MASDVTKGGTDRRQRHLAALALVAAVLAAPFVTPALADSLVNKMHDISDTLKSDLSGVLDMAAINYSEPNINTTYLSNTVFNMKGMGILYNVTNKIIDVIVSKAAYPEGTVDVTAGHVEFTPLEENWKVVALHYVGIVCVVALVALFVVFFPVCGLCWCCCYCAQSRSRQPFDRKHDSCIKGCLALLLICVLTLFMFGVVSSFVTDEHMEWSARELPASQRVAAADLRAFLNATDAHQRHLLVDNYNELADKLNAMIDSSGRKVSVQLGEFSRAVSVTTLNKMVQDLDHVRANLVLIKNATNDLQVNAGRLDQRLRNVKQKLLETLRDCSKMVVQCRRISEAYKIGELGTEIDYNKLPSVTSLLERVNDILSGNIKQEVQEGQRVFNDIKSNIERSVEEHIPAIKTVIEDTGKRFLNTSNRISEMVSRAEQRMRVEGERVSRTTEQYVDQYEVYRRYVGVGVCSLVLTVLFTVVMGLLCGVCGKRPEGYGNNDCCNKGAGSRCLITGIVLIFLLGWMVAVVMLSYFLIGVASQRLICDPLQQPEGNRLFGDLEKLVDLEYAMFEAHEEDDFNMQSVISDCHRNLTIYKVLHLHRSLDLEQQQVEARGSVRAQVTRLASFTPPRQNTVILRPGARDKLRRLADTGLSDFPFDKFTDIMGKNITSIDLTSLAQRLSKTAEDIQDQEALSGVALQLQDAAGLLLMYQRDNVDRMVAEITKLNDTAIELRDGLKFNHSSFKNAVEHLLDETASAETFLSTQGTSLIRNLTQEFAEGVAAMILAYVDRVVHTANEDLGRCAPVSNVYNATLNAVCRKILMPANGFWMSLAWCLLLFFPIIMISSKLAKLYTNTDPYPGPLVEAEYMYDAYADRDNIPLANAYLAEKRSRRERGGGGGGGGAGGEGARPAGPEGRRAGAERASVALEGAAAPPPVDAHNARRYNDMAPKHWEEGPPRYHGPTEYERPPPYYYPGPNDRE